MNPVLLVRENLYIEAGKALKSRVLIQERVVETIRSHMKYNKTYKFCQVIRNTGLFVFKNNDEQIIVWHVSRKCTGAKLIDNANSLEYLPFKYR